MPLPGEDFERFLRHARLAQRDLRTAAELPDLILDWTPPGLSVDHADSWAPVPRTARGILTHALQLEVFYREGLKDGPATGIFERVGPAAAEQERTVESIVAASRAGLDRVWHPRRVHPLRPEPGVAGDWTIRKAIRRLVSHNRAHAAEIQQRRIWILHGVPRTDPKPAP